MVTVQATVTDVNRQVVVASATSAVHPAAFYLAARVADPSSYFWITGRPVTVQVIAVRPDGGRVAGVAVHGFLELIAAVQLWRVVVRRQITATRDQCRQQHCLRAHHDAVASSTDEDPIPNFEIQVLRRSM